MVGTLVEQVIAFGTDGIRGNAERFPFTDEALIALGRSFALWAREKYNKETPKILIGADTRISGPRIKRSLVDGMCHGGVQVVDAGIVPTPAVCQLILYDMSFDAGIVISASHNPYHDNGIKVFDARRCKITPQDEHRIIELFDHFFTQGLGVAGEGNALAVTTLWPDAAAEYQRRVLSYFPDGFLQKVKVVLDCANGATSQLAPNIFRALGATVETMATSPDGTNINDHCGALYPDKLAVSVRLAKADVGFGFDGDGDRLVAVSRDGVVKDGDDVIDLLLDLPAYRTVPVVVGTVMTNQGFERHLGAEGKCLLRTKVGDKYVAAKMEEEGLPLGGELSGHTIVRDYLPTSDGIFVALKVMESIIANSNWNMQTFAKFPQVLVNVPVAQKKDLTLQPFAQLIADYERQLADGRLVVRYSGTEHVLRIMTEASIQEDASSVAHELAHKLQEALARDITV